MENAQNIKAQANEAFKTKRWVEAVELYSAAAAEVESFLLDRTAGTEESVKEANRMLAVVLSNRSQSRVKLEEYGYAISDASKAIEADPTYIKGYYRRGSANFALGKYKEALRDFKKVRAIAPADKDGQAKYKECDRRVKEQLFAAAICEEEREPILDSLNLEMYSIPEASYDGPRLPDSGENKLCDPKAITSEFVTHLLEHMKAQKKLHVRYAVQIMAHARALFLHLPSVVDLPIGKEQMITVCGDTHGQYYDLLHIFEMNGLPSAKNPYLFNGDFVDRGSWSVEVIMALLAFKVMDPNCIYLTRGNHESRNMNKIYGFEGEVKAKYTDTVFEMFMEVFKSLPLAYVLDGSHVPSGRRALVLHGGLFSKDGVKLEDLRKLNRNSEPDTGLMAEMLWSDPQTDKGWGQSKRGIGASFGPDVTARFLADNNLDLLVRSHEMKPEGYEVEADGKLITIFSAPNYCDQMGNKGAYIHFRSDMKPKFTQFAASKHPDLKAMAYASGANQFGF